MMAPQRRIDFTMFVEVGSYVPGAVVLVQEEYHAFPDVYEEADIAATPIAVSAKKDMKSER